MPDIDKLFEGMGKAPMFGRGNYMAEGLYVVELTNVFVKPRFKGGNVFIAEFKILESNNDKHKVGTSGSWCPKLELPNTFGDIKSLVFASTGTDPKSVKAEDVEAHNDATLLARAACGSDSAKKELEAKGIKGEAASIVGARVRLECIQTKTKENKDFTRYTWSPPTATQAAA
jgi:hypothetical protein